LPVVAGKIRDTSCSPPHHPSLRLHLLKGKLAGLHSILINISHRISLEIVISEREIILINIGAHDEVY
jgi:mRNA-degrading endonuclease YafQ of YafQ-DinJ toxin-antitoxin module